MNVLDLNISSDSWTTKNYRIPDDEKLEMYIFTDPFCGWYFQ